MKYLRADVTFYYKLTELNSSFQTFWSDYCKEHTDSYEKKRLQI